MEWAVVGGFIVLRIISSQSKLKSAIANGDVFILLQTCEWGSDRIESEHCPRLIHDNLGLYSPSTCLYDCAIKYSMWMGELRWQKHSHRMRGVCTVYVCDTASSS